MTTTSFAGVDLAPERAKISALIKRTQRRRRRGYVMLEAMVSGALLAVALGSAMSFVGHYRVETTMASRRAEASAIAISIADELVTRAHATGSTSFTPVPNHPHFESRWIITNSGLQGSSTPALGAADELHLVRVTVKFPVNNSTSTITYERLKRKF